MAVAAREENEALAKRIAALEAAAKPAATGVKAKAARPSKGAKL